MNSLLPFHFALSTVSRKVGQSAIDRAAYVSATKIKDLLTNESFDYRSKCGVVKSIFILPFGGATELDAQVFWNQVERRERRWDSRIAREVHFSLPCVLSEDQNWEALVTLAKYLAKTLETPIHIALHLPMLRSDDRNIHGHLLFATRDFNGVTLGKKHRDLDNKRTSAPIVEQFREQAALITNQTLKRCGHEERVDHRSYKRQKIEKEPGVHMGPIRWWAMQRILREIRALEEEEESLKAEIKVVAALNRMEYDVESAELALHAWAAHFRNNAPKPQGSCLEVELDGSLTVQAAFRENMAIIERWLEEWRTQDDSIEVENIEDLLARYRTVGKQAANIHKILGIGHGPERNRAV